MVREAFDYEFIPQCVFIKDGHPYYVGWDTLGINLIQEFMIRYKELAQEGLPYLQPVPNAFTIYQQHYLKHIGVWLSSIEIWIAYDGKDLWIKWMDDKELKNYPHDFLA